MANELIERIRECPNLPSLPAAALEVLELTRVDDVDMSLVAAAISRDPALSTRILRTVNSAFYGQSRSISTIRHATAFLGLQPVRTLVLGLSLMEGLARKKPKGFQYVAYWKRSIFAATAASVLADKLLKGCQETAFLAGLLMDVGMLVLDQVLGEEYGAICDKSHHHPELARFEKKALGITHEDVADILSDHWQLPTNLSVPMANHHRPSEVENEVDRKLAEIAEVAGRCADIFVEERPAMSIADVRKTCMDRYGVSELDCDAMLCTIGMRTRSLAPMFEIQLDDAGNYDAILKRANEELLAVTLAGLDDRKPKGSEKRRSPRVRRDNNISILPCVSGTVEAPITVRLRDVSSRGVGLMLPEALEKGRQFVIQLPQKDGRPVSVLYTVVRCQAEEKNAFQIGAEMECILNPEEVDSRTLRPRGPLGRIREAVLPR